MSSFDLLSSSVSFEKLEKIYYLRVRPKAVAGLDKIDKYKFDKILGNEFKIIERKVLSGKYTFTRYKKILISKGEGKNPRVINIPTIRDKMVLAVLNDCFNYIYDKNNCSKLPQLIIDNIKNAIDSQQYNYFIKYDIQSFYASINHDILIKKLKYKIRSASFLNIILNAIENDGIVFPIKKTTKRTIRDVGIPEGLSISNSLANIYLMALDKKISEISGIKYYRYVDDILILCNLEEKEKINLLVRKELCKKLKLELNKKCDEGCINENAFEYLGYHFEKDKLSVRKSSRYKLENSIEVLMARYKLSESQNKELLEWKLNLKISGCIYKNKKYGWLFFYSQINDKKLLSQLDWFVLKLLNRYNIDVIPKKFKKTYYEIRNNLHNTKYIINFDNYSIAQKKDILTRVYKKNIENFKEKQIDDLFENIIFKDIALLEEDIQHFS